MPAIAERKADEISFASRDCVEGKMKQTAHACQLDGRDVEGLFKPTSLLLVLWPAWEDPETSRKKCHGRLGML